VRTVVLRKRSRGPAPTGPPVRRVAAGNRHPAGTGVFLAAAGRPHARSAGAPFSPRASPQNPHKSASAAGGPHKNPTYETALSGTRRHGC
jgi:hypothetical protein